MPDRRSIIYWDACVFLEYINGMGERVPILEALLNSSASDSGAVKIHTSSLSIVEVSFAASEREQQALDPEVERRIDNLWADSGAIVPVEYHDIIGREARRLIRDAIPMGWRLRPQDAVHLATAQWLSSAGINVEEFHTYDKALYKYADIVGFKILEPYTPWCGGIRTATASRCSTCSNFCLSPNPKIHPPTPLTTRVTLGQPVKNLCS